ncbi:MAG: RIP metalloprotease RseP [Bdellovibrionales bacterium]|nr:RIP metalloprotease RseP [Bdellovibrionales bacterium]
MIIKTAYHIFNFILAFVIFFSLLIVGERIPEIKIGAVTKETALYQNGLRTGDVLVKVNGNEVYNPSDLMVDGNTTVSTLTIKRDDEIKDISVNFQGDKFFDEVLKYPPFLRKPYLVDYSGNRFIVTKTKGQTDFKHSIEELANMEAVTTLYLYPVLKNEDLSLDEVKVEMSGEKVLPVNYTDLKSLIAAFETQGFRTIDLMVRSVNMGSPADKVGIKGDDVFVGLEGEKVFSFEELRTKLQTINKPSVEVEVYSKGELKKFTVTPEVSVQEGKSVKLLGVYSYIEVLKTNFVLTKSKGLFGSTTVAISRTWDSMKKTVDGFVKLLTNQVSLKSIGGPLAIGKVAHDSFNTSLSYFFQLMALISVNLGVINLFPIPVLDGGHIMFIVLEIVNRGPLSRRKMEIAQQVGLSVLLMLMVGAIFNDVTRFF